MDTLHLDPIQPQNKNSPELADVFPDTVDEGEVSFCEEQECNNNDISSSDQTASFNNDDTITSQMQFPIYQKADDLKSIAENLNPKETNQLEKSFMRRKNKSRLNLIHLNPRSNTNSDVRLSIIGRPLPQHRSIKLESRFYKQQVAVYNFIQRPRGFFAVGYHITLSVMVLIIIILTIFSSIQQDKEHAIQGLKVMDLIIAITFSCEFIARFWSSSCIFHYRGWNGKLRFLRNPFRIIDLIVIATSLSLVIVDTRIIGSSGPTASILMGLHMLQVFQLIRLEHRFRPWRMMSIVFWSQREHLAITTYITLLALLFTSFLIYFVEKDFNNQFDSLATSLWFGVVTLCTVGYGDITPTTALGKALTSLCIIFGVSLFALPSGILGTGLALKVEEQRRQRQLKRRKVPAVKLIQSTWRCYVASETSMSVATWKAHRNLAMHLFNKPELSNREKNAIRFIRIVKYFVARRDFKTARMPYDIKDVLEQYAAGHADVLGRVKHMQSKLNAVQNAVNANTKYFLETKGSFLDKNFIEMKKSIIELESKFESFLLVQKKTQITIERLALFLENNDQVINKDEDNLRKQQRKRSI